MPKSDIATGKQLLRDMNKYAQKLAKDEGCSFTDAVRAMRDNAAEVAREVGVSSSVFVTLWAEGVLRR